VSFIRFSARRQSAAALRRWQRPARRPDDAAVDLFARLAGRKSAREHIVTVEELISAQPGIVIGSWRGRRFAPRKVAAGPGFAQVPAVRAGRLRRITSAVILQPGPAAMTNGRDAIASMVAEWSTAMHGHSRC
jgi:iron complex transport system substrate-binding protein